MFLRPATESDHEAVLALAKLAGFGMTSLPPDEGVLREKIAVSSASFAGSPKPNHETYFFVLEDPEAGGAIVGTCGIKAHIGLTQPFYSYKLTTITQNSQQLEVFSKHTMLQVTNDLTGCTEIGSLFLHPEYRRDRIGKLLSMSRFMFIAAFRERFAQQVIAEMRGVHDADGNAPFYNAVAKHFFQMPFTEADYINATQGNQFINDLMPKYPIYLSLLPKAAQRVVGQVNAASEAAMAMLEKQGFRHTGYVDIFDGGPTLVVHRDDIKTIRDARHVRVVGATDMPENAPRIMASNDQFASFRCAAGRMQETSAGEAVISTPLLAHLGIALGDTIRVHPI
jgi:arginine N-succinyltransferase